MRLHRRSSLCGNPFVASSLGLRSNVSSLGKYIADFVAPSVKVIVEVDGGYHASRLAADAHRDRYLARAGYRVVRISAEVVLHNLAAAVALVRRAISG